MSGTWPGSAARPRRNATGCAAAWPSRALWDAYLTLLAARGLPAGSDAEVLDSLAVVARDRAQYDDLWQLAEDLLTHDELAGLWRARHVAMVERQIGTKSGTGGFDRGAVPAVPGADSLLPPAVGTAGRAVTTWSVTTYVG